MLVLEGTCPISRTLTGASRLVVDVVKRPNVAWALLKIDDQ